MPRDNWTRPEADAMVPRLEAMVAEGRRILSELADLEAQLNDLRIVWGDQVLALACPDHVEFKGYLERHNVGREKFQALLVDFAKLGVEVKDVRDGLIDFRGKVGSVAGYLCWKAGEPRVRFWHTLDTGFAGRKPIPGA